MRDVVTLQRLGYRARATSGVIIFRQEVLCHTLELPWVANHKNISCIPEGSFFTSYGVSASRGNVFRVKDVPGREGILIHAGNSPSDTQGCVLVGLDVDGDRLFYSRVALDRLFLNLPSDFILDVRSL